MSETTLPPISYDELIAKLTDPDSDLDHFMGYLLELPDPGRMAPELAPNPSLVTGIPARPEGGIAMGFANMIHRNRRHKAYKKKIADGWTGHRIVSEGDSWFQYPTKLKDIIDHLMPDHAILSLGAAGDELNDIQNQREMVVNLQAQRASALLLSGGGNDLFDNGQMGRLVETPFPGATAEDLLGDRFDAFLRNILGRHLWVFTRVHAALPHVHILVHGYSNAFPRNGAWIEKPLTDAGVPKDIQHDIVKLIVKRFNAGLKKLAARTEFHGKIAHVDLTDIGGNKDDWHDEIHLNSRNAEKAADRFRLELRRRLTGPVPESGLNAALPMAAADVVGQQAEILAAFDSETLLRELDLRASLIEMDPSMAGVPQLAPLVVGRDGPELGTASLKPATRRLMDNWEHNLQQLICSGRASNAAEQGVLDSVENGKVALAGALAGWLIIGPSAVPPIIASALGAWLADKTLAMGRDALCLNWTDNAPASPSIETGAQPTTPRTVGELRAMFDTPAGAASFTRDDRNDRLGRIEAVLANDIVPQVHVPVDADGANNFRNNAATIFEMLGGDADDVALDDGAFGHAEAITIMDGSRPAVYVRDGFVDLTDQKLIDSGWLDEVKNNEQPIRDLIAASGRVIRMTDRSADMVFGSAWMLKDGRVATARHVLEGMAEQSGDKWFFRDFFFVDFGVEADRPVNNNGVFRIAGVAWAGPQFIGQSVLASQTDVAILDLVPVDGRPFPKPIDLTTAANGAQVLDDGWFINVGHPASPRGDWLVDAEDGNDQTISRALVQELIGDKFGVKRLSPGRIQFKPGMFHGDETTEHVFTHNATTLGGSSGSGILSLSGGPSMSGLHFAGKFGTRNYAHYVPKVSPNWP